MQGLPWACWRLTDTTGRCAVRFCNYFWGLGRASSKPGGVMAQRPLGPGQHGGRPMAPADAPAHSASICPSRGVRLGPHRRRLAKKKKAPPPWVKGGGGAIQDADSTPASLMRKRATLFRIFDADSTPSSHLPCMTRE